MVSRLVHYFLADNVEDLCISDKVWAMVGVGVLVVGFVSLGVLHWWI